MMARYIFCLQRLLYGLFKGAAAVQRGRVHLNNGVAQILQNSLLLTTLVAREAKLPAGTQSTRNQLFHLGNGNR
ncbi:Uncharacterised protein [Salmonella enterica subsp. arizonae]|nr:Uncharacterised protein [Salmonella enterica subsp. arizonae]VDY41464.1 Uncharacterised protein [Salmonella enterica subsp. arizonae]